MKKIIFKLKAVIFDMDGVITNTMPYHYATWKMVLAKEGIYVTHLDIYSREGQRGIHSVHELAAKYHKNINEKKARQILEAKEALFKKNVTQRFILGARSFIKGLHKRNFRLALVTGTARHEMHRILPDQLFRLFDVVVTGNDVVHGKPHPEPYLKAIKLLKIKAKDAVVIENAPFGIESARMAGIKCLGLETSLSKKYLSEADFIFRSFKDIDCKIQFVNNYE